MTAKELLKKYQGKLEPAELDQILALAMHKKIEYLYKNPEKKLSVSTVKTFKKLFLLRLANWPLAYLKGDKEFCGLKFKVNKNTLVPRPESELIVAEALKYITRLDSRSTRQENNHQIIDIGCGSGALILSLAKLSKKKANYIALDISAKTLGIAKTNARKLGLKKIKFIKSDLLKNVLPIKFDLVLANLPYLNPKQLKEPSIKKEPRLALLSGQDGLDHYRQLFVQVPKYLNKEYLLLLEINPEQKEAIEKIITANLPDGKIKFLKDLTGHLRVVKISN
ncbi:MAG: peptide chain release factor N(5)-glutamine methyltransferase [bacterium]|nr:peptide chain release factor N(5)-glutamine methyltransferase [bacterium]